MSGFSWMNKWFKGNEKIPEGTVYEVDGEKWIESRKLGEGAYAAVYLWISENKQEMAVKKFIRKKIKSTTSTAFEAIKREISIMKELSHPRIVNYLHAVVTKDYFCIGMEFVPQGSLGGLTRHRGGLPEEMASGFTRQILEGVVFLHGKDIVHRDIKGDNILLSEEGGLWSAKIGDFGLAKHFDMLKSGGDIQMYNQTLCGTYWWVAPEALLPDKSYGKKVDVFSVGCTVVEMLTQFPPLRPRDNYCKYDLPLRTTTACKDFIRQSLQINPQRRKSSAAMLRHRFVTSHGMHDHEFKSSYSCRDINEYLMKRGKSEPKLEDIIAECEKEKK